MIVEKLDVLPYKMYYPIFRNHTKLPRCNNVQQAEPLFETEFTDQSL